MTVDARHMGVGGTDTWSRSVLDRCVFVCVCTCVCMWMACKCVLWAYAMPRGAYGARGYQSELICALHTNNDDVVHAQLFVADSSKRALPLLCTPTCVYTPIHIHEYIHIYSLNTRGTATLCPTAHTATRCVCPPSRRRLRSRVPLPFRRTPRQMPKWSSIHTSTHFFSGILSVVHVRMTIL